MTGPLASDTRTRLVLAAAALIERAPGEDFSLRAVCDEVGVRMPTLYHFFGSKQGLTDAVVSFGFDRYLDHKRTAESSGDPIQDIRAGWDAHVAFGLANPGLYALMYGTARPGYAPAAHARPTELLSALTERAAADGRLVVSPEQAAAHILAANVGVTLRQIALASPDESLSAAVREATIEAITGSGTKTGAALAQAIEDAASRPEVLGTSETRLLIEWLRALKDR